MVQDSVRRIYCLLSRRLRLTAFKSNPRHPRLVACAIATLLLGAISATVLVTDVGASFGSTIPVLSGVEPLTHVDDSRSSHAAIGLAFAPTSIDLSASSLTLNWWATACGPTPDEGEANRSASPSATEFEAMPGMQWQNTTCGRSYEAFSVSVDFTPVYAWNASDTILNLNTDGGGPSGPIRFTPQETFDTAHNFTWIAARQSLAQRRQHSVSAWYPFDRYAVSTTVEAFRVGPDAAALALPVHFLHMYSGLTGYELRIDSVAKVKTAQSGEALFPPSLTGTPPSQRCKGVKLFAVTLFLTNYILAAAMVWVAVCAHYGPPLPETALFLPLANILLLPQLRAAMPGVPDFGIFMDLFGYYVNIVAICFAALFMFFKIIGSRIDSRAGGSRDEEAYRRASLPLYHHHKEAFPAAVVVKVVPFAGSVTVGPPSKHDATEADCAIEHVEDVATAPEAPACLRIEDPRMIGIIR